MQDWDTGMRARVKVAVSACLLGEAVRYDGGHKRCAILGGAELNERFEWVAVCPEMGAGMGTPRAPVTLVGQGAAPRMVSQTGVDWTAAMVVFVAAEIDRLGAVGVAGLICKSRSPSCGARAVPVGGVVQDGLDRGLFVRAFVARFPDLPVADEIEFLDAATRPRFLAAALAITDRRE
jgi:uncharacterized protein YbbK (DUF523 family)